MIRRAPLCLFCGWFGLSMVHAAGCRRVPRSEQRPTVAVVQGVPIYVATWQRELLLARSENLDAAGPQSLPSTGKAEHGRFVLDDLINRQLLVQQADQQQVAVSSDEIEVAYNRLQAGWQDQAFSALMAHEDMSVGELRALVRETLLIQKYMRDFVFARLAVTDAQIETYAAAHPERLKRDETVHLAQIVVKSEADAKRVTEMIRRGKAFAEVAKSQSQAPDAKYGGDLGRLLRGQLPETFERVCFSLPVHTLSPIVASAYGYHLFWVYEHTMPGELTLAHMRTELQADLRQQAEAEAQVDYIAKLRQDAKITIDAQYLAEAPH